jgi:SAM-dependent methyltransferase
MNLLESRTEPKSLAQRELLPLPAVQDPDENLGLEFTGERMIPGQVEFQLEAEHRARYEFAARNLPKGRVLDDGCGAGYGSMILARNGFEVVGIDIDSHAIAHCQKTCSSPLASFRQQDSAKLSFLDASFDGVVSFEVIEHIQEYRQYLAEAQRVLRPGGLLIISTPNKSVYTDQSEHHNPFHVHEFYLEEFRKLLKGLFPHVTILGQWNAQGILIGETPRSGSALAADWLLRESAKPRALKQARYFVAVCRKADRKALPDPRCGSGTDHSLRKDAPDHPAAADRLFTGSVPTGFLSGRRGLALDGNEQQVTRSR